MLLSPVTTSENSILQPQNLNCARLGRPHLNKRLYEILIRAAVQTVDKNN